jgi:protein MpaA
LINSEFCTTLPVETSLSGFRMAITRPRAERGAFPPGAEQYGRSFLGASLIWFPAPDADRNSGLVIAGTHGDENSPSSRFPARCGR